MFSIASIYRILSVPFSFIFLIYFFARRIVPSCPLNTPLLLFLLSSTWIFFLLFPRNSIQYYIFYAYNISIRITKLSLLLVLCLSVCPSLSLSLSVCLSLFLSLSLSIRPSVRLSVCSSVCLSVCLSVSCFPVSSYFHIISSPVDARKVVFVDMLGVFCVLCY